MADTQELSSNTNSGTAGTLVDEITKAAEDDTKLLNIVNQKFKDMQKYKQDAEIRSRLNMMYYKGKHWRGWNDDKKELMTLSFPSAARPVTINLIRLAIRAHVSNIGKLSPQFRIVPIKQDYINDPSQLPIDQQTQQPILNDPSTGEDLDSITAGPDMTMADNAGRVMNLHLERFLGATAMEYILKSGLILGLGLTKNYWDINREKGLGGMVTEPISWYSFFYDSTCKDLVAFRDARVMCHFVQRDVNYVKETFNVDVQADNKESPDGSNTIDKKTPSSQADTIIVYETWVKEMVPYENETIDPETGEVIKLKHERFSYKVYTHTLTKMLAKQENPLGVDDDGNGVHPFCAWPVEQCPDELYPYGMVNDLRGINQEINLRYTQISAAANLTSNPPIFVVEDSGVEENDLTNIIGRTHTVKDKSLAPFSVTFSGLGADAYNSLNLLLKQFQDMANLQDAALGRPPAGVGSGAQLQILLDANNAATGMWVESYKEFLKELARKVLTIMRNKVEAPRQYAFDGGKGVDVFTFDPRNLRIADVKVSIENNIGGKASFRDEVFRLMQLNKLSTKSGLKLLGFQDVDDIDTAIKEEKVFDAQMGVVAKQAQLAMQEQPQTPTEQGMQQVQNNVQNLQAAQQMY
jgi:hypothetical protein